MITILISLILACSASAANLQASLSTQIQRIEIDGKEIKTRYRVFVFSGKWIEAKRTHTGFILPRKVRSQADLPVLITFGKHKLAFSEIEVSKFNESWTVGIDTKPFSERFARGDEAKNLKRIYYIKFTGEGAETLFVVRIRR
jgi:hypothetical protein